MNDDCGNCGHSPADHNEQGDCMHFDRSGCSCFQYIALHKVTAEMRARLLFGHSGSAVFYFPTPFQPGAECMVEGCESVATGRILVNIWGSVCEYETCDSCRGRWHGKRVDDFPLKSRRANEAAV